MKPIIMSTDEVRSILDGRKTMFRQAMKPQPTYWDDGERLYDRDSIVGPELYNPIRVGKDGEQYPGEEVYGIYSDNGEYGCKAPYKPGDVLWVRETWAKVGIHRYLYQADGPEVNEQKIRQHYEFYMSSERWMSPVTMPREAARLFLRVTDVRAERVQDITEADADAERTAFYSPKFKSDVATIPWRMTTSRTKFRALWDSIYAKRGYGWGSNPWLWVIEFERTPSGAIGPETDGTAPNGDKGAEL